MQFILPAELVLLDPNLEKYDSVIARSVPDQSSGWLPLLAMTMVRSVSYFVIAS